MFSLDKIEADILEALDEDVFPGQEVVEQAYEDTKTLLLNAAGDITPYIAVQFGDLQPWGSTSFVGPRGDDYVIPLYLLCVAPTPAIARGLRNRGIDLFLGQSFEWAGQIRKRVGGGIYPMKKSDGTTSAYIAPLSFGLVCQLVTIPTP